MSLLVTGIVVLVGIHLLVMLVPASRDRVKGQFGEGPYKGLFSLVSAIGLGLMIYGFYTTRGTESESDLYAPQPWARHAAMGLVLLAFIFIGASHGKGHLKLWLKHPMSIGIGLWAIAHLLTNGERSDVVFFAAFLALAAFDVVLATVRGKVPHHAPRFKSDVIAVVVGVILYLIFLLGFHPYILKVPVVA
jgi:uncharacterized membrane protein